MTEIKNTTNTIISINYDALGCVSCLTNTSNNVQKLTNRIFGTTWGSLEDPDLIALKAATDKAMIKLEDDIINLKVILNSY